VKRNLLPYLKQKFNVDIQHGQVQIEARSILLTDELFLVGLNPLEIVEVKMYDYLLNP
jgi:hypothetical protein